MRTLIALAVLLAIGAAAYAWGGKLLQSPAVKRRLEPLSKAAGDAIKQATDSMRQAADSESEAEEEAEDTTPAAELFDSIVRDIDALKQKQAERGLPPVEAKKRLHELEKRYRDAAEQWGGEYTELAAEQNRIAVVESDGQAIDADVKAELLHRLEQGQKSKAAARERLLRRGAKLTP